MKIIRFLKTDVKIINSYFLIAVILIILISVGYFSYALFSFTKTSNNVIEGTVGELKKSGTDTLIKLTDNKDNSGLYTITHEADNTLQIGANESITEYRYRGASPKNYVTFNNEVWRILGVFPTDDGTGNIENRIKIIRDQSIGNYQWNTTQVASTSSYNNWTGATLMKYLNGTYYNSLTNDNSIDMVDDVKYYLGGFNAVNATIENMYGYERKISGNNTYYYRTNPNSWTGKLALMYASDYGYAASDECTQTLVNYDNATCKNNNWLYNIKVSEWILPQDASNSSSAFYVSSGGGVYRSDFYVIADQFAVRPVLYLISSVQIAGGNGTSSSPYTLGL
mgnify:CR=1 FL=1